MDSDHGIVRDYDLAISEVDEDSAHSDSDTEITSTTTTKTTTFQSETTTVQHRALRYWKSTRQYDVPDEDNQMALNANPLFNPFLIQLQYVVTKRTETEDSFRIEKGTVLKYTGKGHRTAVNNAGSDGASIVVCAVIFVWSTIPVATFCVFFKRCVTIL